MRAFQTIVINSCMELVRQPVYLMLLVGSSLFMIILASVPYFGLGDDPTLVKNSVLAMTFMTGLFGGIVGSSLSISKEVSTGTALAVMAKPVKKWIFVLGKYVGLSGALFLLAYSNMIASLTASRMAYDAYSGVDWNAFLIFTLFIAVALILAGVRNYVFRKPFLQEAAMYSVISMSCAFLIIWKMTDHKVSLSDYAQVDWRLFPSILLIYFAILVLAAIAVVCSTRLDFLLTLGICYGLFLLGLMSDYFFGQASSDGLLVSKILYTLIPNWQLYWMADAIQQGQSIPVTYIFRAFLQMLCSVGWLLILAVVLFEDRELTS